VTEYRDLYRYFFGRSRAFPGTAMLETFFQLFTQPLHTIAQRLAIGLQPGRQCPPNLDPLTAISAVVFDD
jgi:hypothetical protein